MRLTKIFSAAVAFLAHQTHAIGNNETRDCTVHDGEFSLMILLTRTQIVQYNI